MCADVVMLIRDVATRDMVEDKLFWDANKKRRTRQVHQISWFAIDNPAID